MDVLQIWNRLIDYLERLGAPKIVRYPHRDDKNREIKANISLPSSYIHFVECFGYPTVFIDDDLCLGFLSPFQLSLIHI